MPFLTSRWTALAIASALGAACGPVQSTPEPSTPTSTVSTATVDTPTVDTPTATPAATTPTSTAATEATPTPVATATPVQATPTEAAATPTSRSEWPDIYALNQDPPPDDTLVSISGIVTGTTYKNSFWIQDPGGGQHSGIYVYAENKYPTAGSLPFSVGDAVTVSGAFKVFYDLREISLSATEGSVSVNTVSAGVPAPLAVSIGALSADGCATGLTPATSGYVGVLLALPTAEVMVAEAACGSESYFGYSLIGDTTGTIILDDDADGPSYTPTVGDRIDVTGILTFTFDQYKIEATQVQTTPEGAIYNLNREPPANGTEVTIRGVVTGTAGAAGLWVQETDGGLYSGIYVDDRYDTAYNMGVTMGDEVQISGTFRTSNSERQVQAGTVGEVEILNLGLGLPEPIQLDSIRYLAGVGTDICDVSQSTLAEPYTAVLVRLPVATIVQPRGYCGTNDSTGIWAIWDSDENPILVDDSMGYSYQPYAGYQVVLTGMLRYHGGVDQYRFEPIKDAGIEQQ